MGNIEEEFKQFLQSTPTNSQVHFSPGDRVKYYVHPLEVIPPSQIKKLQSRTVEATIVNINPDGTYDIRLSEHSDVVEKNWPPQFLFPA